MMMQKKSARAIAREIRENLAKLQQQTNNNTSKEAEEEERKRRIEIVARELLSELIDLCFKGNSCVSRFVLNFV
jgi:hypothetical protein